MAVATQNKASKKNSLDQNLVYLRELISVETLLDPFNQEEALEFFDAVVSDIEKMQTAHKDEIEDLEEKIDSPQWSDLLEKVKENLDDDKAEELLEVVTDHDEDIVRDAVSEKGFVYVKINSMVDEQKLRDFIEREIYSSYNEQMANILF